MALTGVYTSPVEWVDGQLVTAADLNTYHANNTLYLYRKGAQQGTAFPGSPASGDRFFRTDLLLDCVYDGTRWLSAEEYAVHFNVGSGITTNQTFYAAIDDALNIYLTRFVFTHYVATTNNNSNYWTAKLYSIATSGTLRDSRTSFASAANTWSIDKTNLTIVGSGIKALEVDVQKIVGSPGALDGAVAIFYRKIIV